MKDLFLKYKENGKVSEALIVGQNMFNKFPGEKEYFEPYFTLLAELAANGDAAQRTGFLQQAMAAIAAFSENADLTEETVEYIAEKEALLEGIYDSIEAEKENKRREAVKQKIQFNDDALSLIEKLLSQIEGVKSNDEFEKIIQNIGKVDSSIDKDYLSERQMTKYSELTKASSNAVSAKMAYFEKEKTTEYNLRAIEAYEKVFEMFKNNNIPDLHKNVIKNLFAFDAKMLYNETLVYYNHVYNYILSKLDDEGKFKLTKYAILSEKRGCM